MYPLEIVKETLCDTYSRVLVFLYGHEVYNKREFYNGRIK